MFRQLGILHLVSGLTCSLVVIHPAAAGLHAIVDVPGLDPASILHEFDPFRIVQMPEISCPAIDKPPEAIPPAKRTLTTPPRSRRTLPDRSFERRRLPLTEIPKAELPTQRQRILGPPGS